MIFCKNRGFTFVEFVLTIVITMIVFTLGVVIMTGPIKGLFGAASRANWVDVVGFALNAMEANILSADITTIDVREINKMPALIYRSGEGYFNGYFCDKGNNKLWQGIKVELSGDDLDVSSLKGWGVVANEVLDCGFEYFSSQGEQGEVIRLDLRVGNSLADNVVLIKYIYLQREENGFF